jgi:hypothetical protein
LVGENIVTVFLGGCPKKGLFAVTRLVEGLAVEGLIKLLSGLTTPESTFPALVLSIEVLLVFVLLLTMSITFEVVIGLFAFWKRFVEGNSLLSLI